MEAINTQFRKPSTIQNEERYFQLQRFWEYLDIQFEAASPPLETRWLRVAGLLIKLECRHTTLLRYVDIQLACCYTGDAGEPDAVFYLWCGNIAACLPEISPKQKIHIVKNNVQALIVDEDKGRLYAFDNDRNRGYLCLQDDCDQSVTSQGYLLYQLLYSLAKHKGRLMLHGASIGYENKGALICGGSGHGKSTLAVSSLLQGCQYVSDDHLMLTRSGSITRAWPVYSVASLYETTLMRMPELCINKRWLKEGAKHVFDVSAYHPQFCFGLPLKALIFPVLALEEKETSFAIMPAGQAITHLIWSTIKQVNDRRDAEHVRNILDFLRDLPCYRLILSSDIELNAKTLKELITNELK